jgi:peptide/histidine transporter 3/4
VWFLGFFSRFLDKAAVVQVVEEEQGRRPWRLCSVTEVEEVKLVLRLLPIWVAAVLFATMPAQISTFYTRQGTTLDGTVAGFKVPAASLQSVNPITIVVLMPLYDRVFVPLLRRVTGNVRGISMLQRIGVGLVISLLSMVAAAGTEIRRLQVAREHGLVEHPEKTVPLSVFVLLPQYVLIGAAEVFTSVGALEFFYDQAPDSMRSLGTALFLTTIGVGNFLSSALLSAIVHVTGHHDHQSWIVDNLNHCRLDYFYWLLAGLSGLNLCFFMGLAHWYKYKRTESVAELAFANNNPKALALSPVARAQITS